MSLLGAKTVTELGIDTELVVPPTVHERYYTPYYDIDTKNRPWHDMRALVHTNGLVVITLAESHPLLTYPHEVVHVNYCPKSTDRTENKPTGRGKKGSQWLQNVASLCDVKCADGNVFRLVAAVNGKLMEVNPVLQTNPKLLATEPNRGGWLAILNPKKSSLTAEKARLLSHDQYQELLRKRATEPPPPVQLPRPPKAKAEAAKGDHVVEKAVEEESDPKRQKTE